MKRITTFKPGALLLAILSASIPVFAGNVSSTSVHLPTPTQVGSSNLPAGDYKLTWSDTASSDASTQVNFVQGKKVIATAPARVVPAKNDTNTVETNTPQPGTTVLQVIRLAHVNLSFGNTTTAQR
jgi:hypothetical protein